MAKKTTTTEEKKLDTAVEMRRKINEARKELFDLKMDRMQGKLKNVRLVATKRKEIARMLTKLAEAKIYAKNA